MCNPGTYFLYFSFHFKKSGYFRNKSDVFVNFTPISVGRYGNEANFHYSNEDSNLPANVAVNLRQQQSRAKNDRLYAVLYTSGSTGCPKGARILQSAIINRLMWQWEKFPYQPNDVCVFKVSSLRLCFSANGTVNGLSHNSTRY